MNNKKDYFEKLVNEAVLALPEKIKKAVDNAAFVVEDETRRKKIGEISIKRNEVLVGLYEGIPKIKRDDGYFGVLPDKITIFRKPIEGLSGGNEEKLKDLVNETVWHEVGHHLGLDDEEIKILERKRQ
ncbi:MAG: metallopeptidase family protein [bacterium]|nr:metallopeptidase family protein [bacterium]